MAKNTRIDKMVFISKQTIQYSKLQKTAYNYTDVRSINAIFTAIKIGKTFHQHYNVADTICNSRSVATITQATAGS